jgi:hypothetical protein
MKLERERDIPAFKGKNWREKIALRRAAEEFDPWILRLKMLIYFLVYVPIMYLSIWLAYRYFPHFRFLAAMAIVIALGLPISMVFYSLLIVPRI